MKSVPNLPTVYGRERVCVGKRKDGEKGPHTTIHNAQGETPQQQLTATTVDVVNALRVGSNTRGWPTCTTAQNMITANRLAVISARGSSWYHGPRLYYSMIIIILTVECYWKRVHWQSGNWLIRSTRRCDIL